MVAVRWLENTPLIRRRQAACCMACAALLALGGCHGSTKTVAPAVDLFHGLQGGVIAQQRPPPPGADDPWPNLAQVPPRPTAPDIVAQQRIEDRLAAQRNAAEASAKANPLTAPPPPPPSPKPPAAPNPDADRVVVDAAPPPPVPPPTRNAPPAAATAAAIPGLDAVPAVPTQAAAEPLPSLAAAPPPVPTGVGIDVPNTPIRPWAMLPAAPTKVPANTVMIVFTPGSDQLPPSATLNLRRFALAHRGIKMTVTGRGGDVLPGADPQSRALDLALHRAQAIAASLGAAGVASGNLVLRAEAAGQGGSASL